MVIHIVNWNINDSVAENEKENVKEKMKELLEGLVGVVPGLISARVITKPLASSNTDIALYCEIESVSALDVYKNHPAHVAAGKYVRSVVCDRRCLDFEV